MKALSVVLALLIGIGCLVAAMWLGSQSVPKKVPSQAVTPLDDGLGPKIAADGPHPKAVASETEYNFGAMQHLSKGSHEFTIRNEGEAPLELMARKEDRTCQCTGATLTSDEPVPPGGDVKVKLEWEIKAENPNFRHSAKIRSNDPEHQVIELVITGKVEKGFQFSPAGGIWDLGNVETSDSQISSTKAMFSQARDHFEIRDVTCANSRLKCTWEPLDADALSEYKARSGYLLHLTADLSNFTGVLSEQLEIHTDIDEGLTTLLSVRARRPGPIELIARNWDPENNWLYLGEFPANQGKQTEILVYSRIDEELKLLSAESQHDSVKVKWEQDDQFQGKSNVRRYRLKIEVPPGPAAQRRRDAAERIDLKFDNPQIGTLQIFVDYLAV
jgi:hypothetical protein